MIANATPLLIAVLVFGLPVNIIAFMWLHCCQHRCLDFSAGKDNSRSNATNIRRRASMRPEVRRAMVTLRLLQAQLNVADLIVLGAFVPHELIRHLGVRLSSEYSVLCKLGRAVNVFAVQAASNAVVCIAIDRAFCALSLSALLTNRRHACAKWCIGLAWFLAGTFTMPTLFIYDVYEDTYYNRSTCNSFWNIERLHSNLSGLTFPMEQAYYKFHNVSVFFLPAAAILTCYTVIIGALLVRRWKQKRSLFINRESNSKNQSVKVLVTSVNRRVTTTKSPRRQNAIMTAGLTSVLLTVSYLLFWTPYNLITIGLIPPSSYAVILQYLNTFNSVINPFLYGYGIKEGVRLVYSKLPARRPSSVTRLTTSVVVVHEGESLKLDSFKRSSARSSDRSCAKLPSFDLNHIS